MTTIVARHFKQISQANIEQMPLNSSNLADQLSVPKACTECRIIKPLTDFHRNRKLSDGHENQCKLCRAERDSQRRASKRSVQPSAEWKPCSVCKQSKPAKQFHSNPLGTDGLHSQCKDCKKSADAKRRAKGQQTVAQDQVSIDTPDMQQAAQGSNNSNDQAIQSDRKTCRGCKLSLCTSEFSPDQHSQDKPLSYCKACLEKVPQHLVTAAPFASTNVQHQAPESAALFEELVEDARDRQCATANKRCTGCREQKAATEFQRDKSKTDRMRSRCKACEAASGQARRRAFAPVAKPTVTEKDCRRCKQVLPAEQIYRKRKRLDGLDCDCKACHCHMASNCKRRKHLSLPSQVISKACQVCRQDKPLQEFDSLRSRSDAMLSCCRTCKAVGALGALGPADT